MIVLHVLPRDGDHVLVRDCWCRPDLMDTLVDDEPTVLALHAGAGDAADPQVYEARETVLPLHTGSGGEGDGFLLLRIPVPRIPVPR